MCKEEKLCGNVNEIVRIGDTIHRTRNWNPLVHRLLQHLEAQGFQGAPRFVGIDDKGREILSYIPGEAPGNDYPEIKPYMWSETAIAGIAGLLRRYHDATQGFLPAALEAGWHNRFTGPQDYEVICHNDAALYNIVFQKENPAALIDFDLASPGPRIWDIVYTLYTVIPLSSFAPDYTTGSTVPYDQGLHAADRHRRIALFFDTYGAAVPIDLKEWVIKRIKALCDTLRAGAAEGNQAYQRMIDEGHLAHYEREIEFLQVHFSDWA